MDEIIDELIVDNLSKAVAFFNAEGMLSRNNREWEVMRFGNRFTDLILFYSDFIDKFNIKPLAPHDDHDMCQASIVDQTVRVIQRRISTGAIAGILVEIEDISHSQRTGLQRERILSDTMWKMRSRIATVQNVLTLFIDFRKHVLDQDSHNLLVNCRREVWELERQVENLRYLMLVDVGPVKFIPQPELLNLQELVNEAIIQCEPLLCSFTERPDVTIAGDLALRLITDRRIVVKAISSLLFNALVYNNRQDPVVITISGTDHTIKVSIEDHGWGIADDEQSSIFSYNYRGKNARTSSYSGLGIELYLMRRLLTLLDGGIEFISREHQGSRFTIFFRIEGLQL